MIRSHILNVMVHKPEQKNMTFNVGSISLTTCKHGVDRKKGIVKRQIKLLTSKTILAGWTKVPSQALIHLKYSTRRACYPYARLGTSGKTPNIVKVWKSQERAIAPSFTMGQCTILEFAMGWATSMVQPDKSPKSYLLASELLADFSEYTMKKEGVGCNMKF